MGQNLNVTFYAQQISVTAAYHSREIISLRGRVQEEPESLLQHSGGNLPGVGVVNGKVYD